METIYSNEMFEKMYEESASKAKDVCEILTEKLKREGYLTYEGIIEELNQLSPNPEWFDEPWPNSELSSSVIEFR